MCDPTLGIATAFAVAGGLTEAAAHRSAGKYNEKMAQNQAQVQEWQATDALKIGAREEAKVRMQYRQLAGRQRAALGAGNVELGTGSAVDLLADTAMFAEIDALTIRSNAAREAWAHRIGANDSRDKGRLARFEGSSRAIGTLLTTGNQVAGIWADG